MANAVGTYSVPEKFSIQGLTESQATTFISGLARNDVLYALHKRATQLSSSLDTPIKIVTWIAYTVFQNASSWSNTAKEIANTGLSSNDLTKKLNTFQNGTNLHICAQSLPEDIKGPISRTLQDIDKGATEVRDSVLEKGVVAKPQNLDLSNKPTFTDLPSEFSMMDISAISLENNALFRICETVAGLTQLKSLNVRNTSLSEIPTLKSKNIQILNLSQNPNLTNIDTIKSLKKLKQLDISETGLTKLPDWLWTVQKPLTVTISEDMEMLIPQGQPVPKGLSINIAGKDTDTQPAAPRAPVKSSESSAQPPSPLRARDESSASSGPTGSLKPPALPPSFTVPDTTESVKPGDESERKPATPAIPKKSETSKPEFLNTPPPGPETPGKAPEQKKDHEKKPESSVVKTPFWRSLAKWTGIFAGCAAFVALIGWGWKKLRA